MATQHNFRVKNGLEVAGTERISSAGVITGALSGSLASATTATTQSASDNSTKIATTAYTDAAITALVDSSPGTLNTLNELAAALGDDASFSTTVTNSIATKLPLAGGTLTGTLRGTSFSVGAAHAGEALNILDGGHTGHGAANTVSLASFAENASGNSAGLWVGSMTNENTAVIGSRTASGNIAFQTYTGGSWGERMRITNAGNVGIGDTPGTNNKFRIKGTVIGTAANLSESAALAILSLNYPRGNVNSGIHFGYATANYIQAADDSGSNAKQLTLNPFGGNVGIGTCLLYTSDAADE